MTYFRVEIERQAVPAHIVFLIEKACPGITVTIEDRIFGIPHLIGCVEREVFENAFGVKLEWIPIIPHPGYPEVTGYWRALGNVVIPDLLSPYIKKIIFDNPET